MTASVSRGPSLQVTMGQDICDSRRGHPLASIKPNNSLPLRGPCPPLSSKYLSIKAITEGAGDGIYVHLLRACQLVSQDMYKAQTLSKTIVP